MAKLITFIYFVLFSSLSMAIELSGNWEGDGYLNDSDVQAPIHQKLRVVIAHIGNQLDLAICRIELDKDHEPVCLEKEYIETRGVISKTMTGEVVGQMIDDQIVIDDNDIALKQHFLFELTEKNKMKLFFSNQSLDSNHVTEISGSLIRE
jgi:hypothetical protein